MWTLAFSAEFYLTDEIPPTTSVPLFELVIVYRKDIFPISGPPTTIFQEERLHESTVSDFLSVARSSTICETLMSTMSFARTEADPDQFSSTFVSPSIMQYAESRAKKTAIFVNLTKLRMEAVIVDDVTPNVEGMDFITPSTHHPQLYVIYQPRFVPSLHHSVLTIVNWMMGDSSCAVCQENFVSDEKVTCTPCNHYFHRYCIIEWLFQQGTCSICRNCFMIDPGSDSDADS